MWLAVCLRPDPRRGASRQPYSPAVIPPYDSPGVLGDVRGARVQGQGLGVQDGIGCQTCHALAGCRQQSRCGRWEGRAGVHVIPLRRGYLGADGDWYLGAHAGRARVCARARAGVCVCEVYTMCLSGEPDKRYRPCATLDSPCGSPHR